MTTELRHEPEQNRYTFWVDGDEIGLADYRRHGNVLDLVHTEIDPARRRSGYGAQLVQGALDDIRANTDARVVASCPFVRRFIEEHPDYEELTTR
ncbi:GNAT family N-acetyltransferase [Rathayibacter sp. YIM 133350]|uniref:GNAT family N-acetyltransferase n=1 Tax=Rathayibacter sp. YIM 133350 TaxID=3131992 RepID=UPI003FD26386